MTDKFLLRCFPDQPPAHLPYGFQGHLYRGKVYPPFIEGLATDTLARVWQTNGQDTLICSHQKVGTHLVKRFLVELLAAVGGFSPSHPCHGRDLGHGAVPWPEVLYSQSGPGGWEDHLQTLGEGPRLWYTHCCFEDLPLQRVDPHTRFILVYRDPKDVAVSQYFFYRRHPLLGVNPDLTLEAFVDLFLAGALYFGDYHHHVLGWLRQRGQAIAADRLLVLRYEDLVLDKLTSVDRIARFMVPGLSLDRASRDQIAHRTEFEVMKAELTHHPQSFHFRPENYFRSGRTGDWQNHLSPDLAAPIDQKTRDLWAAVLDP